MDTERNDVAKDLTPQPPGRPWTVKLAVTWLSVEFVYSILAAPTWADIMPNQLFASAAYAVSLLIGPGLIYFISTRHNWARIVQAIMETSSAFRLIWAYSMPTAFNPPPLSLPLALQWAAHYGAVALLFSPSANRWFALKL